MKLLEIKCHQCGNKHCSACISLNTEQGFLNDKESIYFHYSDSSGISRHIFVSKESLKKLQKEIKTLLK